MEDEISRFFKFKWGKSKLDVTLMVLLILTLIGGVGYLSHLAKECSPSWGTFWDLYINLLASLLAFIFAFFIIWLISWVYRRHEDELKVSYKNSQMLKIYKNKKDGTPHSYRKAFPLHADDGAPCIVYCKELFLHQDGKDDFAITDIPDKYFEVNHFIEMYTDKLLEAHSASTTTNEFTPRLEDFAPASPENKNKATLTITRSTYLNHLLTNRVLDYQIAPNITLRRMYESIDELTALPLSKLSNHIGINALLFLVETDKQNNTTRYLVLPHRGKDATVVKNGVTASVATRLMINHYEKAKENDSSLVDYIEHQCVRESVEEKLPWDNNDKVKKTKRDEMLDKMQIRFLGLARDPYEGGKPTLFYTIDLAVAREDFASLMDKDYKPEGIDAIQDLMIVAWDNIRMDVPSPQECEAHRSTEKERAKADIAEAKRYDKAKLKLIKPQRIVKDELKDIKDKSFIYEQNLIANFWFYLTQTGQIE